MKTSRAKFNSAGIACGMIFLAAVSSVGAQDSRQTTPVNTSLDATQNNQTTVPAPPNQFTTMDTDKDGKISAAEYTDTNMAAFRLMDKDRDGQITAIEMTEAQPASSGSASPSSSAHLSEVDVNKDGRLTATEASSGASRMFKNLDINGDLFLSANELEGRQYRSDIEARADTRKTTKDSQSDKSKEAAQ